MTIKFARFDSKIMKMMKYEFENEEKAMEWIKDQTDDFKIRNGVKDENTDNSYLRYKSELMDNLASQVTKNNNDYDKCRICSLDLHEGKDCRFCRCEDRNIRIARYKRILERV